MRYWECSDYRSGKSLVCGDIVSKCWLQLQGLNHLCLSPHNTVLLLIDCEPSLCGSPLSTATEMHPPLYRTKLFVIAPLPQAAHLRQRQRRSLGREHFVGHRRGYRSRLQGSCHPLSRFLQYQHWKLEYYVPWGC